MRKLTLFIASLLLIGGTTLTSCKNKETTISVCASELPHAKILKEGVAPILEEKGYTLIPLKIYFNKDNRAKVLLGVCKGKKDYDKRESIKERDIKRHTMKVLKERY